MFEIAWEGGFVPRSDIRPIATPEGLINLVGLANGGIVKTYKPTKQKADDLVEGAKCLEFSRDGKWFAFYLNGVLNIVDVSDLPIASKSE